MMEPLGEIQRRLETVELLVHDLRRYVDTVNQSGGMPVAEVNVPLSGPKEPRSTRGWESLIGGRGLFYAGLALVAIAFAYFFKLAFDLWIGPVGRVGLGIAIGAAFIAVAYRFVSRNRAFVTEGIFATGVLIEYFTIYAAFQLYHIFNPFMAYAAMIGVTMLSATASWKWKSERMACFAAVGAFITPLLIANHDADRFALASYVAVVDFMFLSFAWAMRWAKLPLTLLLGTLVLFWSGIGTVATLEPLTRAAIAVSYFLLFCVSKRYAKQDHSQSTRTLAALTELVNVAAATIALKIIFPLDTQNAIATTFLLGIAVFQAAISSTVASRRLAFAPVALALQTAVPADFISPAFSIFTVALASFGHRFQDRKSRLAAYVGQGLLLIYVLNAYANFHGLALILNERFGSYVAVAAGLCVLSRLAKRSPSDRERHLPMILRLAAHLTLLIAGTVESNDLGNVVVGSMLVQTSGLMLSAVWSGFALIYIVEGFIKKRNYMRWSGLALLGIVMAKLLLVDLATFDLKFRIGSALAVGVIAILVAVLYQKRMGAQDDTIHATR